MKKQWRKDTRDCGPQHDGSVVIENPERHVRKASHRGSKQQ